MSNAYDFSSGFLAAKQLQDTKAYRDEAIKLQREEMDSKAPYLKALANSADASAGHVREQTRGLRSQNDMTDKAMEMVNPIFDKIFKKRNAVGLNADPVDFGSITRGFTTGFKPNYSLSGDSSAPAADTPPDNGAVVTPVTPQSNVNGTNFADGTRGGLGLRMPASVAAAPRDSAIQDPALAAAPTTAPATDVQPKTNAPTTSGIELLAERNPGMANSVTRNVFDMSNKEFQQLSGALSLVDFARGKITAGQLTDHVENLRKIQAEGVMRAAQAALSGNEKQAVDLYHEYGDDNDSVASMKKISIANPVPGAAKKTKDSYDGVLVTMKDGSSITLDPRRLALDIIGTKASMDHDEKVASSIRTTDANVYHTDAINQANTLKSQELALAKQQSLQMTAQQRLAQEFKAAEDNEMEALLKGSRKADLLTNKEAFDSEKARIDRQMSAGRTLAAINIELGNLNIDSGRARAYSQYMNVTPDDPKAQFWGNPQNFQTGPNGKPLVANVGGRLFYKTNDGVAIPVPPALLQAQPQQQ